MINLQEWNRLQKHSEIDFLWCTDLYEYIFSCFHRSPFLYDLNCNMEYNYCNIYTCIHNKNIPQLNFLDCSFTKNTLTFLSPWFCIGICLCHVGSVTNVFHSFGVFELLILPFDKGLSDLNFPWSSVFSLFYFSHSFGHKLNFFSHYCFCIVHCSM